MNKIKHIIFDLDDTLYPQAEYTRQCLHNSCEIIQKYFDVSKDILKKELDIILDNKGIEYRHIYDDLFEKLKIDGKARLSEIIKKFKETKPNIQPYKNTVKVLEYLVKQKYILSIITDGPVEIQKYKIQNLGIEPYFSQVIYTDEFGVEHRKPSEKAFNYFLGNTGANPQECIYIGNDPGRDFIPAKKTGMYSVRIVQGEYKNLKLSKDFEAEYNIFDIIDLINLLEEV